MNTGENWLLNKTHGRKNVKIIDLKTKRHNQMKILQHNLFFTQYNEMSAPFQQYSIVLFIYRYCFVRAHQKKFGRFSLTKFLAQQPRPVQQRDNGSVFLRNNNSTCRPCFTNYKIQHNKDSIRPTSKFDNATQVVCHVTDHGDGVTRTFVTTFSCAL